MRTTRRFTPAVIARFIKQGRGQGTYADYAGWHRVTRGDPASSGRSHLLRWRGRLHDLLSDGELGAQLFATMLPDVDDCLEQYKLAPEDDMHPLAAYGEGDPQILFPGTSRLAVELGINHPTLSDAKGTVPWVPTSDLVVVFKAAGGARHLLALAFKPNGWETRPRTRQLLRLEREFWVRRDVPWLLITPRQYEETVVLTLRRTACWALADDVSSDYRQIACRAARANPFISVTQIIDLLQAQLPSKEIAQHALWQSVWSGELPIDLRRGWRPHLPLLHISRDEFFAQNPIASRRSAWT